MYQTLQLLFSFFIFSLNAHAQQLPPVTDTSENKTFSKVEIEAEFPGGGDAWLQYLGKNLDPNVPVRRNAPAGTYVVVVRFIIATDGNTKIVQAETNHGYGMEEELMRIIKRGRKWKPATQDGIPVNAYRRQPITFMVSEK